MHRFRDLACVVLGVLVFSLPTHAKSISYEDARGSGDTHYQAGRFDAAVTSFQAMVAAAASDNERLSAHWRLAKAAAEAGDRTVGLHALDAVVQIDENMASDAQVEVLRARLLAYSEAPAANTKSVSDSDAAPPSLPGQARVAIRAAMLDLAEIAELTSEEQRAARATKALERLWPHLIDYMLPDESTGELWQAAGWAVVYSRDEKLAPITAAMVRVTWPDWDQREHLLTLSAELLRLADEKSIQKQIQERARYRQQAVRAQGEDSGALSDLCWRFATGTGAPEDDAQAFRLCSLAVKQDSPHPHALNTMGWLFGSGQGCQKDESVAVTWYRRSAELGYAQAMHNLGIVYNWGLGVDVDMAKAVSWYQQAARAGHTKSREILKVRALDW